MNRRGLLACIHVAKKELRLDDDTYRAALEQVVGKSSAGECSDAELSRLADHFRRLGWAPKKAEPKAAPRRAPSSNPHVRKVWAVWGDLERSGALRHPGKAALYAFVERMTGVTDPHWLSPEQANQVVEGLKAWRRREAARASNEGEKPEVAPRTGEEKAT